MTRFCVADDYVALYILDSKSLLAYEYLVRTVPQRSQQSMVNFTTSSHAIKSMHMSWLYCVISLAQPALSLRSSESLQHIEERDINVCVT